MIETLSARLRSVLRSNGADLAAFGRLDGLPPDVRCGLPVGVSVAIKYPRSVIRSIHKVPTPAYYDYYVKLSGELDALVEAGAAFLREEGFVAIPQTRAYVERLQTGTRTPLPHKTVATRAGLGWIGKSALLVTPEFGTMVRLGSILTDAPLETSEPVNESRCGDCSSCTDACPAGAIKGRLWSAGMERDEIYDANACRSKAHQRALENLKVDMALCGRCIEACPNTQRHLRSADEGSRPN